jgi:integrase
LLALKWTDLTFETRQLRIQRTVRRIPRVGMVESEPKSARSRRLVTLTPTAITALRKHHIRQTEMRLKAALWEDRDLVFSNGIGRPLETQNVLLRSFYPLLARAKLPKVRFHDLRHSTASLLLASNVHPRIVADLLGHSNPALVMSTYSHVAESLQAEAADQMEALLGRA